MDARKTKLLNINILACSKPDRAYIEPVPKNVKPLLQCTKSLERDNIEIKNMNITAEF